MKILVYGMGVIGGCLASVLCKTGHDITVLARGRQKTVLESDGLVAKNYFTKKTDVSHPRVIDALAPDDRYDAIFAVMQFRQMEAILPDLAENSSPVVVLVGNNMDSPAMEAYIHEHSNTPKAVVFGFQATGGERVDGHYTYVSFGTPCMELGSSAPRESWLPVIEKAFSGVKYGLHTHDDMDSWYKAHAAVILPVCYVCYKYSCDLHPATKHDINKALTASLEGLLLLRRAGYDIPQADIDSFSTKRARMYVFMWLCAHTRLGELAASRHAKNAVGEMTAMSAAFDKIIAAHPDLPTPTWNALERHLPVSL